MEVNKKRRYTSKSTNRIGGSFKTPNMPSLKFQMLMNNPAAVSQKEAQIMARYGKFKTNEKGMPMKARNRSAAAHNTIDSRGNFMKDIRRTNKFVDTALSEEDNPTQATTVNQTTNDSPMRNTGGHFLAKRPS